MWVWSDELIEKVSSMTVDGPESVPLVGYAVSPGTDLVEFAREVLPGPAGRAGQAGASEGRSPDR